MSQRIADASAKVARPFYSLPRTTDNILSASLGQFAGLSGEVVQHSFLRVMSREVRGCGMMSGPRLNVRYGSVADITAVIEFVC